MKVSDVILLEGGNIWKDDLATQRINQADVIPTVKFLEKLTGLPLVDNMFGSTGKKPTSGDLDLGVDSKTLDKATLEAKLKAWAQKNDQTALTKKTGVSVHFRTPIKGNPQNGYVQTDFMFVDDLAFSNWAMAAYPSAYKGADRHVLMASLAKAQGLKWSFKDGLTVRDTGTPLRGGKEKDQVAKVLLGPRAKPDDLNTVESILKIVEAQPDADTKLQDFRNNIASR